MKKLEIFCKVFWKGNGRTGNILQDVGKATKKIEKSQTWYALPHIILILLHSYACSFFFSFL
jgi:hypothetical protein